MLAGLRLLHRISVPGSNLKVGPLWETCLGVQPSVGVSVDLSCQSREHRVDMGSSTASTWFTRCCVLLLSQEQEIKAEHIIPVLGCWAREGLSSLVMRRKSLCGFEVHSFPLTSWAPLKEKPVTEAVMDSWTGGLTEVFHEGIAPLSPWQTLDELGSSSMKSHSAFLRKNFHPYPTTSSTMSSPK